MSQCHCLLLPDLPHNLPDFIQAMNCRTLDEEAAKKWSLEELRQALVADFDQVQCIVGSDQTPTRFWLQAIAVYPKARLVLRTRLHGEGERWNEMRSGEELQARLGKEFAKTAKIGSKAASKESSDKKSSGAAKKTQTTGKKPVGKASGAKTDFDLPTMTGSDLARWAFIWASWGKQEERLQDVLAEAARRDVLKPGYLEEVRSDIQAGENTLALKLKIFAARLQSESQADFDKRKASLLEGADKRSVRQIEIALEKDTRVPWSKADRPRVTQSGLPWISLQDGRHPNSLRHLEAARNWDILIDETGEAFGPEVDQVGLGDNALGRIAALALPVDRVKLPRLRKGFHARSEEPEDVDKAMKDLLRQPVGVLGFTQKDAIPGLDRNWVSGVVTLMRWVLRLLPVDHPETETVPGESARITFHIENRSEYTAGVDLFVVARLLRAEMAELDPRFAQVNLEARFITKDGHRANGYIDALAYTWGSQAAVNRDRLRRSRLQGHCLLRPSDEAMERLYLLLDRHRELEPSEWYTLVSHLQDEPAGSLAREISQQLGGTLKSDAGRWKRYLAYVQSLMQRKDYVLAELCNALDWLAEWQPAEQQLPPRLQLLWRSASLARHNHMGAVALEDVRACLALSRDLREEAAAECCEADLRVAVAATNSFDFESAFGALNDWVGLPAAVPGLRNWAKVQSSLGQHAAFLGEFEDALNFWRVASEAFARLSDASEKQREARQTGTYRLLACIDQMVADSAAELDFSARWQELTGLAPSAFIKRPEVREDGPRFEHHLLVRAMVALPGLESEIAAYLDIEKFWFSGIGHPWPLINAYRAALLHRAGKAKKAAIWAQSALDILAAEEAPLLQWMRQVLAVWLKAEGIRLAEEESDSGSDTLKNTLPAAPHEALAEWSEALSAGEGLSPQQNWQWLNRCLPFNFH